jgi:hypothetical protein
MDLINVLKRLNAISEESNKKPDADKDGVPDWADKKPGADDTESSDKKKANEDIMNVMRGLKAIQETEELDECGDMEMPPSMGSTGEMSPLSIAMSGDSDAEQEPEAVEIPGQTGAKDRYTLSITKADGTTLNATTDVPEELAALMKAVGMGGTAAVAQAQQGSEEVEEEFGNTPNATKERDPRLHGQTKDWGLPGTGAGKPNYPGTKASGDNPMAESMFKEYLKFKSGK